MLCGPNSTAFRGVLPWCPNTGTAGYCSDSLVARPGGQVTGKDSLNMAAMSCSILA